MDFKHLASEFFGLIACIMYLFIFLFVLKNVLIRLTPYRSRRAIAVASTIFLLFTGTLYTWMASVGYGSGSNVLPSHVFILILIWTTYFREGKESDA